MNIPTSLIVVGLVVAWLVVLVPMVARRRERVPQAPASGAGMRVLRRASASLRRRPRRSQPGRAQQGRDRESGRSEEVLVSVGAGPKQEPTDAAEEWAAAQAEQRRSVATMTVPPQADPQPEFAAEDDDFDDRQVAEPESDSAAEATVPVNVSGTDGTDAAPGRAAGSGAFPDEVDEDEWAAEAAAAQSAQSAQSRRPEGVEDEHLRPVPRRPGRGGYDPEAAEVTRAYRYRQRRRITFVLLIATVVFSLAGGLTLSVFWVGAVVSFALLAGYLAYLRRQVRIEAAIRQRRMERLQRARQIRPEFARSASRGVRPDAERGREVVDLDDDDPGFDDFEQYEPVAYRRAVGQ